MRMIDPLAAKIQEAVSRPSHLWSHHHGLVSTTTHSGHISLIDVHLEPPPNTSASPHPNADVATPNSFNEDGETMGEENGDDAAMMAMMGVSGFGSTKVMFKYHFSSNICSLFIRESMWQEIKKVVPVSRKSGHGVNT